MIARALTELEPNAEFAVNGDVYSGIQWFSSDIELPSESAVNAKIAELEAQDAALQYRELRRPEYPPLTDLADAIFWQQQGDDSKMAAYVAACEAVKAKYPKPE